MPPASFSLPRARGEAPSYVSRRNPVAFEPQSTRKKINKITEFTRSRSPAPMRSLWWPWFPPYSTFSRDFTQLTIHPDAKEKEWTDCVQSDIRAFGIAGDWKATALNAEVWVETVTEGGRRFKAAWRKEEVDAARHRREKREATRLGTLLSQTEV